MPFTVSHAAVALVLRRTEFPFAAVVIAAMIPDLAVFYPDLVPYGLTHSPLGLLVVDLPVAVVVTLCWWWIGRPTFAVVAPSGLQRRLPSDWFRPMNPRPGWGAWCWLLAAVLVGAVSHVVWDSFTHAEGWSVTRFPILTTDLIGVPLYKWAQYGSTVVGAAVLAVAIFVALRKASLIDPPRRLPRWGRIATWSAMGLIVAVGVMAVVAGLVLFGLPVVNSLVGAVVAMTHCVLFLGVVACIAVGTWLFVGRAGMGTQTADAP